MWKHLSGSTEQVTAAIVNEFAGMHKLPADREINKRRYATICMLLQSGHFRTAEFGKCLCLADGLIYRVNGKHTALALRDLGPEAYGHLKVTVNVFSADTIEDVVRLYSTYDNSFSTKSQRDINHAYAAVTSGVNEVAYKIRDTAVAGVALAQSEGYRRSRISQSQKGQLILSHKDFILWFSDVMGGESTTNKHLRRTAVAAAMYDTYCIHRDAAHLFWRGVRDGDNPDHQSGDRKLRDFLLSVRIANADTVKGTVVSSPRDVVGRCRLAWNAWCGNRPTTLRYNYATYKTLLPVLEAPSAKVLEKYGLTPA